MLESATVLSVNLNKVALLRNARGGTEPCPITAARVAIAAGCGGITLHPRPDLRHARPHDALALRTLCSTVELNLEGNPFAPPSAIYPGFMALLEQTLPEQATLVPDGDDQLTSDHGWNLRRDGARLQPLISRLKQAGMRVSLFMDADSDDIERAAELGADRIEIYTGPYAQSRGTESGPALLEACMRCGERAQRAGLAINAGHDLNQDNLGELLRAVPGIAEVSIGHALISEALYAGLAPTVAAYLRIIAAARSGEDATG